MAFPVTCTTLGKKVEYLSKDLIPAQRYEEYLTLMETLLGSNIDYIDPVHTLKGKEAVIAMLRKVVPRTSNSGFQFELLVDSEKELIWRWTIALKIRWTWFRFTIHGLVHAQVREGKIVYQREYFDPMESIGIIPIFGPLYKLILRMG